jgi:hypothetical protein
MDAWLLSASSGQTNTAGVIASIKDYVGSSAGEEP